MKFHLNAADGNVFTGYGDDYVRLGVVVYRENVVVTPSQIVTGWCPGGFDALTDDQLTAVAALRPEIVLLGTGVRQRFPSPRLSRVLAEARIGLDVMDTPAACRTFNILAAEGRKVAVAILLDPPGKPRI
ncbi:MAG: Mth938-like domain-containing protein [Betaproteobacteria bacterium]